MDEEAELTLTSKSWVHWDRTWLRCPISIRLKHLLRLMALMFHTSYSATLYGPWFTELFSVTYWMNALPRAVLKDSPHHSSQTSTHINLLFFHLITLITASKLMYKSRLLLLYPRLRNRIRIYFFLKTRIK